MEFLSGDGEQTRDFIYVKDIAKANLLKKHNVAFVNYNIIIWQ